MHYFGLLVFCLGVTTLLSSSYSPEINEATRRTNKRKILVAFAIIIAGIVVTFIF